MGNNNGNGSKSKAARRAVEQHARHLPRTEYLVLREFADNADPDGTNSYPGVRYVADVLRLSEDYTWKVKHRLVQAGELIETGRKGRNGQKIYTVAVAARAARGFAPQEGESGGSPSEAVDSPSNGRGFALQRTPDLELLDQKQDRNGRPSGDGNESCSNGDGFSSMAGLANVDPKLLSKDPARRERELRDLEAIASLKAAWGRCA